MTINDVSNKRKTNPITAQYLDYRQEGASFFASVLAVFWLGFAWSILHLESPAWQRLIQNHSFYFPHIDYKKPRIGDPIRYLLQLLWLILFYPNKQKNALHGVRSRASQGLAFYQNMVHSYTTDSLQPSLHHAFKHLDGVHYALIITLFVVSGLFSVLALSYAITEPLNASRQFIFASILWVFSMSIWRLPGRFPIMVLTVLSLVSSARYLWWRCTATLYWNDSASVFFGVLLLMAEFYAFLVLALGFFQTIWPLNRNPVSLPADLSTWPTVDVMFTTYNEDLAVLRPSVLAALGLDWPKSKLRIYILDDGNRESIKAFAESVGVHYIARPTHEHAKAGNINYALKQTNGELVTVFDCDHIPTHVFLQLTVGWFLKDPTLAVLQTPHHFFSPDPFERNLDTSRSTPNEGALFYGVVQDGNDTWNATFFCGSAGVMRRTALEAIGGMAVESVTEDAHTSLRLQQQGFNSAYIRIPLSVGLATESLSIHIRQRIRWARGMAQILRIDNPLTTKGLNVAQRLCYFNATLHFLLGIPRLIFLLIPMSFLFFHAFIIYAPGLLIFLYAFPHIVQASLANIRMQGKFRHFLWNEIYETCLAWHIAWPTTVALFNPFKGKFNVTAKGGTIEKEFVDWGIARPYIILFFCNFIGLIVAFFRLYFGPSDEVSSVMVTGLWVIYNLAILGGALGVSVETKQVRQFHRVNCAIPVTILRANGRLYTATMADFSHDGVNLQYGSVDDVPVSGEMIRLVLKRGEFEYAFPCKVMWATGTSVGLQLSHISLQQSINFVQCTFARADTWTLWQTQYSEDGPIESMLKVFRLDFLGYKSIVRFLPNALKQMIRFFMGSLRWCFSFMPHRRHEGVKCADELTHQ